MIEETLHLLELAGEAVNLFAVALIIAGFMLAAMRYLLQLRTLTVEENFTGFKVELGGALTLGLEVLIIADVIETITVDPSFASLQILAFLVVIRTLLGWTLCLEIEGRWPWQSTNEGKQDE
ncbi:MAG: DUF1622 domain-containing protein [Methyloprofundus sp.]|uniref:DUF1622 domain-containing protein n=1 Tax=Methyloprofundus sp. TaxID=2020875 RepID=UPI001A1613DE|nr:DUF1622 domain-containing protein [Methyloprofundus sp.]HIL77675.1 DUF1622 domain-containing protein [Methylococcales bacterium]